MLVQYLSLLSLFRLCAQFTQATDPDHDRWQCSVSLTEFGPVIARFQTPDFARWIGNAVILGSHTP